jgi:hypothetical protein
METHGHEHAHAAHRTGFRWLDLSLAVAAFVVACAAPAVPYSGA